jgi:ADP-heptose:LPS heptosyltransferase
MPSDPERILLIRLRSIGDVILTLPAVHVIRENFPSAKITFLTSQENVGLLQGFGEVDEVIALDRAALRSGNPLRVVPAFFGLIRRLRAGKFSLAVDLQGYGETAWLTRLTGAPQRWGGVYGSGRKWAYTRALPRAENLHPAAGYLQLLRECGLQIGPVRNQFQLPPAALAAAQQFLADQKINAGRPVLFLQPFTSSTHKNWPLVNFLEVARHFRSQGVAVIFGGGPADGVRLESVRAEGFPVSAGVPLLVTGGLMQLAALTIGGDTGALHLAVAEGRRVLMVLHRLHPGSPMPFQHPDWIIAPPRAGEISGIAVAAVIAACAGAFSEPAGNASC